MAKEKSADPKTEIQEIFASAKKKSLNFALMKSKEGVVLKAHVTKPPAAMYRECKAAGGIAAMSTQGILNVTGRLVELTLEDPDVSGVLAKLAKKYFTSLGVPCKVVFLLPGGARLGDEEDEDAEGAAPAEPADVSEVVTQTAADDDDTAAEPITRGQSDENPDLAAQEAASEAVQAEAAKLEALRDSLVQEFGALSRQLDAAKTNMVAPMAKKVGVLETMFKTTVDQEPNKARGVLSLLSKMLVNVPRLNPAAEAKPSGASRTSELSALEKSVDDLLAEFA